MAIKYTYLQMLLKANRQYLRHVDVPLPFKEPCYDRLWPTRLSCRLTGGLVLQTKPPETHNMAATGLMNKK